MEERRWLYTVFALMILTGSVAGIIDSCMENRIAMECVRAHGEWRKAPGYGGNYECRRDP